MANNTAEEYEQLKKRNRRRLIGTVILVFVVFIVLWKAFSQKSVQVSTEQEILINRGEASTPYTTDRPPLEVMPANASDTMIVSEVIASAEGIYLPDIPAAPTFPVATASDVSTRPAERPDPPVIKKPKDKLPPPIDKAKPANKPPKDPKTPKEPAKNKRPNPQDILDGKVPSITAPPNKVSSKYVIQVAALSNSKQAQELKERLNGIGGITASVSIAKTSKGEISRVRVGPFVDKTEAEKTLSRLKSSDINGIIVQQ